MSYQSNSDERWSEKDEINDVLTKVEQPCLAGGPLLFKDGNDYLTHTGEGHVQYLGMSGTGKSFMGTMNLVLSAIKSGESLVIVDPKGELEKCTVKFAEQKGLKPIVLDFKNPLNSAGWNPLGLLCDLYHSKRKGDREYAYDLINDLVSNLAKLQRSRDGFWEISSENLIGGIVSGLITQQRHVTVKGVTAIISKGNRSINDFHRSLSCDSVAATQLSQYANAAGEEPGSSGSTKASIVTSALVSLSVFNKNEALTEMLCRNDENTFRVSNLRGDKQFIVYIIIPDEVKVFEVLAGIMVSQISMYLIKEAERYDGQKMPIRVNFILEELGNVGKAISNLPHLMSASRSRNIRMHLVLQSLSQLDAIYNKGDSETILSNIGVNILYRTNSWETLQTFSQRCGARSIAGRIESLITPVQLGALKVGQALVLIDGKVKYITMLPNFNEFSREVFGK
jgi:type IV secretion system protein VirD4